jgi:hypothetical protein
MLPLLSACDFDAGSQRKTLRLFSHAAVVIPPLLAALRGAFPHWQRAHQEELS